MKGDQKVIDALNQARAAELTAILQYMAHHYELEDSDYEKLAKILKQTAIQEMKHAEMLAERILFLEGVPIYKPDSEVKRGQSIEEMLTNDRALESKAVEMYNASAKVCDQAGDRVSKELFEKLLADEEAHWDSFDVICDHVEKLGASYLATLTGQQ